MIVMGSVSLTRKPRPVKKIRTADLAPSFVIPVLIDVSIRLICAPRAPSTMAVKGPGAAAYSSKTGTNIADEHAKETPAAGAQRAGRWHGSLY